MIYHNFEAFVRELPEGRPLIGIDLGTKTIGIAVSDVERMIATPYYTLRRKDPKKDMGRLWQIATERSVCGIVLGMPMNMDGSDGPRTQATRAFARNLEMYMPKPLTFWDERLSTVAAERALLEADTSRAKRELVIDKVAASIILQGALDRIAFLNPPIKAVDPDDEAPAPQVMDEPEDDAPTPELSAGRAKAGRAVPRAKNEKGLDKAQTDATSEPDQPPTRDAQAIRRRRTMTRWIGRDE